MAKSTAVGYFLWLVGGVFGLHHFYLGRDRQAFAWWSTCGGFLGLGWLRDLFRMSAYVAEVNRTPQFVNEITEKMRKNEKPPYYWSRFTGACVLGSLYGDLLYWSVPLEPVMGLQWNWLRWILPPFGIALGVHTIGNIGMQCGSIKWPLIAAYATYPFALTSYISIHWCTFVSALAFDKFEKNWKRTPKKPRSFLRRIAILATCTTIYLGLLSSAIYFNGAVTDKYGETIKVRDAIDNFFTSPLWTDLKTSLLQVYIYGRVYGWGKIWEAVVEQMDPLGEQNALQTLGLPDTATQADITNRWRQLSKEWHPDRHRDPKKKEAASKRFIEIKSAYEKLSEIKSHRATKNKIDA